MRSTMPAIPASLLAIQPAATRAALGAKPVRKASRWKTDVQAMVMESPSAVILHLKGLRLIPGDNARECWQSKAARAKWQRGLVYRVIETKVPGTLLAVQAREGALLNFRPPAGPVRVQIVRVGRGHMDTRDNLPGACKHLVDAVAAWLGVDDRHLDWSVAQEKGKGYSVRITIEAAPPAGGTR